MSSDDKKDPVVDYLMEMLDKNGVSATTVVDGHVLTFKRSFLENLVKGLNEQGQDKITIFLKRPDFNN